MADTHSYTRTGKSDILEDSKQTTFYNRKDEHLEAYESAEVYDMRSTFLASLSNCGKIGGLMIYCTAIDCVSRL